MSDHIIWGSLLDYNSRTKNALIRARNKSSQDVLFRFLKENNLVLVKVLDDAGAAILDLQLKNSMLLPEGIKLFEKVVASWLRSREKDGDYENTAILSKGLEKIRSGK